MVSNVLHSQKKADVWDERKKGPVSDVSGRKMETAECNGAPRWEGVFHWLQFGSRCLDHGVVVSRKRQEFN
jgi:hypothetical protein